MNMEALQQSPWLGYAVIAAAVVAGVWQNRGFLAAQLGKLRGLVPTLKPAAPNRKDAIDKYDDCIRFLSDIGCKDGVTYLKAGLSHFYHEHEGPTA